MSQEFNILLANHIKSVAKEHDIDAEQIKTFLVDAIKKTFSRSTFEDNLELDFDLSTNELISNKLLVVTDPNSKDFDEYIHIASDDPRIAKSNLQLGDVYRERFDIQKEFRQNQVQQILQSFKQKITEINNQRVFNSWNKMLDEVVLAEIEKEDKKSGTYTINLENVTDKNGDKLEPTLGFLSRKDLNPFETLDARKKYHFVVTSIKEQSKFCPIILSRISPKLVEYYMSLEVPEIDDGTIKIVASARQAGVKSKLIVDSKTLPVEPAAVCVGPKGKRIKSISDKLLGEKIEVYNYTSNPYALLNEIVLKNQILKMGIDSENRNAVLVVSDEDLSRAIGKKGCNIKLASKISGYNIEVVKLSDFDPNDYDEYIIDVDSNEFKELVNSNYSNKSIDSSIQNLDITTSKTNSSEEYILDDLYNDLNVNESLSELNDAFEDEVKQIFNNEEEEL